MKGGSIEKMMFIPWISTPLVHPGLYPELQRPSNYRIVVIQKRRTNSNARENVAIQ